MPVAAREPVGRDCGVPASPAAVGIGAGDLDRLASDASKQARPTANDACEMTLDDAF